MSKDDDIEGLHGREPSASSGRASALPRVQLVAMAVVACMCVTLTGVSAWTLAVKGLASNGPNATEEARGQVISSADKEEFGDDSKSLSSDSTGGGFEDREGAAGEKDADGQVASTGDRRDFGTSGSSANGGSEDGSGKGAGSDTAGGQSLNGGDVAGGAPESGQDESKTVSVTISADGSLGGGGVAGPLTLTFEEGATVYDALASAGWPVQASWGAFGAYVTSINGVAADAQTGWTYAVNGSMPSAACSAYKLADGDVVAWTFVKVK